MNARGQTHLRNGLFMVLCIMGFWLILRYDPAPAEEPERLGEQETAAEWDRPARLVAEVAQARRQCEDFHDPEGLRRLADCLADPADGRGVRKALQALRELTGQRFLPAHRADALASPALVGRLRRRWLWWIERNEASLRWEPRRGRFEVVREMAGPSEGANR